MLPTSNVYASQDASAFYNVIIAIMVLLIVWLVALLFIENRKNIDFQWIEHSSLSTIVLNQACVVIESNKAANEQLDSTNRPIVGEQIADFIQYYNTDFSFESESEIGIDDILRNPKQLYKSIKCQDRIFSLERSASYKNCICFHLINVTEKLEMNEVVSSAQQLSTKSKLIASALHEIGSPMVAIEGGLEYLLVLLADDGMSSDTKVQMIELAQNLLIEARRVNNIKLEFVGLFRDNAVIDYHNINDLIIRATNLMKYDKRMANIKIFHSLNRNIPAAKCNEGKILQIFLNLLGNAADALIDCYWREEKEISVRTLLQGEKVRVEISDNGIGMSFDILEKATDLYFTTKRRGLAHTGSGLGLVICKELIKQLNGELNIESKINEGTVVQIDLPCAQME